MCFLFNVGLRPDVTGIFNFANHIREPGQPHIVTVPQQFRDWGYTTLGGGKTFHYNLPPYVLKMPVCFVYTCRRLIDLSNDCRYWDDVTGARENRSKSPPPLLAMAPQMAPQRLIGPILDGISSSIRVFNDKFCMIICSTVFY